jgi:hypothetical protein
MGVEDVEVERGDEGVAQRVLLVEEAGLVPGSTSYQVPHSSTIRPTFFSGS